jgi:hypothetical protein
MRLAEATDLQRLQTLRESLSVRQFRRLLAGLTQREVLFRLERSVGGRARGSAGYVYGVGRAGQRLVRAESADAVRRPWTPRPSWLRHALAVSHLYVLLRELEDKHVVKLDAFISEPDCWRQFLGDEGRVTLKPDAFLLIEHGDFEDRFFIEVDCGTESPATLARKCSVYRDYYSSGVEQAQSGVFPRVLWLVPTDRRAAVLKSVVGKQESPDGLHAVARYDAVTDLLTEEPP